MIKKFHKFLPLILIAIGGCDNDDSGGLADDPIPENVSDERSLYQVSTLTTSFSGSGGLTVDEGGFIYVADFGDFINNANGIKVSKVDPNTGDVTDFATGLEGPSGNAFGADGNLYQANIAGNTISKISPQGAVSEFISVGLSSPVGVAFDANDNLYVCNCGGRSIRKVASDGTSSTLTNSSLLNCPNGLTIDDDGNLYVANFNNNTIVKVSPNGNAEIFVSLPGRGNSHLIFKDGVIYALSRAGNRLYKVSLSGEISLIAGTGASGNDDGSGEVASFYIPNGIGVNREGSQIYVVSRVVGTGTPLNPVVVRVVELK